ncbi:hypothetical protein ACP70R_021425 [Stipagrostis hirtigluma subsp. patula]
MASAPAGWAWMAEVAGEELAKLEAAHPGRFGPLKAELQRLVADPAWDANDAFPRLPSQASPSSSEPAPPPPAPPVCSQESSTRKRKQEGVGAVRERRRRRRTAAPSGGTKDRAETAMERAERCLESIRAIKRSLLAAWLHH